jgi:arylsulfatase A-like enzyme
VASSLVLITVDTLRADHVAAYGGPVATPALDRLAAEGVLVERAFTPTPTTGPAHASLFSGWYPWRHGVLDNAVVFAPEQATLAERLQGEGLETAAFVSSYILHPRFGFDRGFDRYEFVATEGLVWRDEEHAEFYARAESTTEQALDWLEPVLERGRRFFLWVHYFDPHFPYAPPEGFRLPPSHRVDLRGKRVPEGVGGRAALAALVRAYQGEVRYVDAEIGRLIETVRQHDPMGQTAIVVTSDHGEGLGDHGKLAHGTNLFEELVRIPLILRAPGLPAGARVSGPVQLEDLYPTLLSILGVAAGDDLDGVDHLAALRAVPGAPVR